MSGHVPGPWTRDYFRQIAGGQDGSVPLKINLPPNSFEDDWNASGMGAYDDL